MLFTIICDALKAFLTGELKNWWEAHKARKAQDAVNQDRSANDADALSKLRKWTRPE